MYRFCYNIDKSDLEKAYKALYSTVDFAVEWKSLVLKHPELKGVLGRGMTAERLLTAPFEKLVDVFFMYKTKTAGMEEKDKDTLGEDIKKLYNYDSYKNSIGDFFNNEAHKFEVHNCVYCDLKPVYAFKKRNGKKLRQYQIEHVLDKGTCPLVGLSLYNFVPSCDTCNGQGIKANNTIGDTIPQVKKLSPTTDSYNFDDNVHFFIAAVSEDATYKDRKDHSDDYEVDFTYEDTDYQKSVDLFELKSRYNTEYRKEILGWADDRDFYQEVQIIAMAQSLGITYDEMYERIFHLKQSKEDHWLKDKARRDILTYTKRT